MLNFKQYLKENQQHPWQVQSIEELVKLEHWHQGNSKDEAYCLSPETGELMCQVKYTPAGFVIHTLSDYSNYMWVEYQGNYYLPFNCVGELPAGISTYKNSMGNLNSLIGFPPIVTDDSYLTAPESNILSLEGCPTIFKDTLSLNGNLIQNNLHKYIKKVDTLIIDCSKHDKVYYGMLGFLKMDIKELLLSTFMQSNPESENIKKAVSIVKKHLKSKDILQCHEELVDAGLEEYAVF